MCRSQKVENRAYLTCLDVPTATNVHLIGASICLLLKAIQNLLLNVIVNIIPEYQRQKCINNNELQMKYTYWLDHNSQTRLFEPTKRG